MSGAHERGEKIKPFEKARGKPSRFCRLKETGKGKTLSKRATRETNTFQKHSEEGTHRERDQS